MGSLVAALGDHSLDVMAAQPASDPREAIAFVGGERPGPLAGPPASARDAQAGGYAFEDLAFVDLARGDLKGKRDSSRIANEMDLGTKPAS
jgi:hypothetical protein